MRINFVLSLSALLLSLTSAWAKLIILGSDEADERRFLHSFNPKGHHGKGAGAAAATAEAEAPPPPSTAAPLKAVPEGINPYVGQDEEDDSDEVLAALDRQAAAMAMRRGMNKTKADADDMDADFRQTEWYKCLYNPKLNCYNKKEGDLRFAFGPGGSEEDVFIRN